MAETTKVQTSNSIPHDLKNTLAFGTFRFLTGAGFPMLIGCCLYFVLVFNALHQRYLYFAMKEPTDSAAYMQVAWSFLHWPPYTVSVQENLIHYFPFNFLGDQLMWTLAVFSPLFFLPSPAVMFLIAQVPIIIAGSCLLYHLASIRLGGPWHALLTAFCYPINPGTLLSFMNFGFRAETLFMPLTFSLFYLIEKNRLRWAGFALFALLLTKHNAILVAASLGLYLIVSHRKQWRFGIFCMLAAGAYYVIGLDLVMAHLQENPVAHFKHFAQFGNTPAEALINIAAHPGKILAMLSPAKLGYFLTMIFPAGFLSLFRPTFWISSTELLINTVMPEYHSIFCGWHWALVVAFIFLGLVDTTHRVLQKTGASSRLKYLFTGLPAPQLALNMVSFNNTVLNASNSFYFKEKNINNSKLIDYLSSIDSNASVMASGQLLWFFSNRRYIFKARVKFHDQVDYIDILLPMNLNNCVNIDRFLIDELQHPPAESKLNQFTVAVNDRNLVILNHK